MKLNIQIPLILILFLTIPAFSQKNRSFELEAGGLVSNRFIYDYGSGGYSYYLENARSRGELLPGFYIQSVFKFRAETKLRPFIGLRAMNQQVMKTTFSQAPTASSDPTYYVLPGTRESDMIYLGIPLGANLNLIQTEKTRFSLECTLLPQLCIMEVDGYGAEFFGVLESSGLKNGLLNVSSEISFTTEISLAGGNAIGFHFPKFLYAVSPTFVDHNWGQHNYSFGLGLSYLITK